MEWDGVSGIREVTASINFRPIPTMSLRGPVNTPTDERRRREFDGTGWTDGLDGLDGISKGSFNLLHTLYAYR